jgi:RimJ/RimL family protein N-acetyltransferase
MIVCETKRLVVRYFELGDSEYVLRQLNERSFIESIADKQVRNFEDAENYLKNGPLKSYQEVGFGLNIVLLKDSYIPIGMCGLIKREVLVHPDLGYAFLPEFWGKGYAIEASEKVLKQGVHSQQLDVVLGITRPTNQESNKLLVRLGFALKGTVALYNIQNNLYEYRENC